MEIEISIQEILFQMQNTSCSEAGAIADTEERYRVEAGSEKQPLLLQCIRHGCDDAVTVCSRFLSDAVIPDEISQDKNIVFDLDLSPRKQRHALKGLLLEMIVNTALSRYYHDVGQEQMSAVREKLASVKAAAIEKTLYEKLAPNAPLRLIGHG